MTAHEVYKRKCKNPSERINIVDVSNGITRTVVFLDGKPIESRGCVRCVIDIVAGEPVKIGLAYNDPEKVVAVKMDGDAIAH